MKKVLTGLLICVLGINIYFTNRLFKFSKASEEYFKYLALEVSCLNSKEGMDQNDIYLASSGLTREKLTGRYKEMLPVRSTYDIEIDECKQAAQIKCWIVNQNNSDHCKQ